jgi:hypothetical protein
MDKEQLQALTVSVLDKLKQNIREGKQEEALKLVDEIDRVKHDFDESYRQWIDLMLTYIADKLGEDALYEIHRENGERALWPRFDWLYEDLPDDEKVRRRAWTWTNFHMSNIESIEEDDEKFTFHLKCDSGGSIRMWPEYGKTKEAHPWSYGEEGFSYYCAHCPIVLEIMGIEKLGHPAWVSEPQPDGRCIQILYKDPATTPEKYYRRVGMTKKALE